VGIEPPTPLFGTLLTGRARLPTLSLPERFSDVSRNTFLRLPLVVTNSASNTTLADQSGSAPQRGPASCVVGPRTSTHLDLAREVQRRVSKHVNSPMPARIENTPIALHVVTREVHVGRRTSDWQGVTPRGRNASLQFSALCHTVSESEGCADSETNQ
jgi:hypothetical protein